MQILPDEIAPGAYRVLLSDKEKEIFSNVVELDQGLMQAYGITIAEEFNTTYSWYGIADWTYLINYPATQGEEVTSWHNDSGYDETLCTLIIYNVFPALDSTTGARIKFKLTDSADVYPVDIASPVDAILLRSDEKKFIHTIEPWFNKIEQRNTLLFGFKNFNNIRDQFNLTSLITDGK